MKALVTGASGFLGGRLAQMLAERGADVRILARPGNDLRHLASAKPDVVSGSLGDTGSLDRAVAGVTHIFHCAGSSTDWAPWRVYEEANITGVRNLLDAAQKAAQLERFVHVSTTDIYGYPRTPCDESATPVDAGLPYHRSKRMGEELAWQASHAGLPVTVVRPATIFGPRGTAFVTDIAALIRQGAMAVIDGGRSRGGFCYVDHVADAMMGAAQSDATLGRAYNLCDGSGVTWRQYVDAIAHGLDARSPWLNLPFPLAWGMARSFEELHARLRLSAKPLLTRHAVLLLSRDQEYPADLARNDWGWKPAIPFEESMARTIQWLRS